MIDVKKAVRTVLCLGVWLMFFGAQAISYTVQVVALSDEASALALQERLSAQGYPAYLVSVPTEAGVVYRLRVGAFANRAAALNFAAAMEGFSGSSPAPALAEGIPPGLIPLEPELVASYPYLPGLTDLAVLPWGEGYALRFQGSFEGEPFEAKYRILSADLVEREVGAWRAAPQSEDGTTLTRVYSFPLWPEDFEALDEEELEAYERSVVETVAEGLGLPVARVADYRFFSPGTGRPYLVRAETLDLRTLERTRLEALGDPDRNGGEAGPELVWFGGGEPEEFPQEVGTPFFEPAAWLEPDPSVPPDPERLLLNGDGWQALPDDDYTRIQLDTSERGWRAVAGTPLWAFGDFLLVYHDDAFQLYRFVRT